MKVNFELTNITESNKVQKYEKLEKSLYAVLHGRDLPIMQKSINDNKGKKLILAFNDLDAYSIEKALRKVAFSIDVPIKASKGEGFNFKAQEQLTDKWYAYFSRVVRSTYDLVIDYFGLPKITVMSKSGDLIWKGKVLYSPESGLPIKQSEWENFVNTLDKFLNRNIADTSKKIILDSKALGKILDRMLKANNLETVKNQTLDTLKYKNRTFDWISDSVKNMKSTFGESLSTQEMARIRVIQQSAAEKITKISNDMKSDVKQILVDGVLSKKGKSAISQALFDKMIGHNRDFQRIADTEIQKTVNNSFLLEEVSTADKDEKVYFQRLEVIDGNTCDYCKKINGIVAVWSNTPLASGKIQDRYAKVAIWEGKEWEGKKLTRIEDVPCGICHPYCRGTWIRFYPETDKI